MLIIMLYFHVHRRNCSSAHTPHSPSPPKYAKMISGPWIRAGLPPTGSAPQYASKGEPLMKITVAGVGYVGLSLAVLLAQHHEVTAITTTPAKAEKLNQFISPI